MPKKKGLLTAAIGTALLSAVAITQLLRPTPPPDPPSGDYWSYAPGFDPTGLPFEPSIQLPEPPTTSGEPIVVTNRDELLAETQCVSDTDANVHVILDGDILGTEGGTYINCDHVLLHVEPGHTIGVVAIGSFSHIVDHVEIDCDPDGDTPPEQRSTIEHLGGNDSIVHEDIVVRNCNIHDDHLTGMANHWTRGALINNRILHDIPISVQPDGAETGYPASDFFILGNTIEAHDIGGQPVIRIGRSTAVAGALSRVLIWGNHFEVSGGGSERTIEIQSLTDLAIFGNTFRDQSFRFDSSVTIGNVYVSDNDFIGTQAPLAGATPSHWEFTDNRSNGTEAAFDSAVSSTPPDVKTGNTWELAAALPAWPSDPGDPADLPLDYTAVSAGPDDSTAYGSGVALAGVCPDSCTWSLVSGPVGDPANDGYALSSTSSPTATFTPYRWGTWTLRYTDGGANSDDVVITSTCTTPIPYYPGGCLEYVESDLDMIITAGGGNTLGSDYIKALPNETDSNIVDDLVDVANLSELDSCCGASASNNYCRLTANIDDLAFCTGTNNYVDLNGFFVREFHLTEFSAGATRLTVANGRIGLLTATGNQTFTDLVVRAVVVGGNDIATVEPPPGGVGIGFSSNGTPPARILIVNSTTVGYDWEDDTPGETEGNCTSFITGNNDDMIVANVSSHTADPLSQAPECEMFSYRGYGALFVDVRLRTAYNRTARRGPSTNYDHWAFYSSPGCRGTEACRGTQINQSNPYVDIDMELGSSQGWILAWPRFEVDDQFSSSSAMGCHPTDDQSGDCLIYGLDVLTTRTGLFGASIVSTIEGNVHANKVANYDVSSLNTYSEAEPDPLVPGAMPRIFDPTFGELCESDPQQTTANCAP